MPAEPVESEFDDSGNFSMEQYARYEARKKLYKDKMKPFLKREEAFKTLVIYIQVTISAEAAVFLSNEGAHSWDLLHTSKLRYSPIDSAKKMEVEARCRELNRGSGNQEVDKWLDNWKQNYTIGVALDVAECQRERSIRDFLYSVMKVDRAWASANLAVINKAVTNDSLFDLISEFRSHARMMASEKLHNSIHSAFSTSEQPPQESSNQNQPVNRGGRDRGRGRGDYGASFRGEKQPLECLCGVIHW